jgi:hypothetical protein
VERGKPLNRVQNNSSLSHVRIFGVFLTQVKSKYEVNIITKGRKLKSVKRNADQD